MMSVDAFSDINNDLITTNRIYFRYRKLYLLDTLFSVFSNFSIVFLLKATNCRKKLEKGQNSRKIYIIDKLDYKYFI